MKVGKTPKHIGVIIDGNRRFAKRLALNPWKGHEYGAEKVKKLIDWSLDLEIKELTIYTLSMQNFSSRSKQELSHLIRILKKELQNLLKDKKVKENKIRFNFIGRLSYFDKEIQKLMEKIMKETKNNNRLKINLALAYGGNEEIVDAVNKILESKKNKINEKSFSNFLYLKSSPDLIIRTGGEKRTSNFLNYQSGYSEWIFLDIMWPEFEKKDLIKCLNEFRKRKRRFGK